LRRERQRDIYEAVEVILRLLRSRIAPRRHKRILPARRALRKHAYG
jgi:hypothetical protein